MSDAQLEQPGQPEPALKTKHNLDNEAPTTADAFEKEVGLELINPSAPAQNHRIGRPSTPPSEKRVIHTGPTSPPPEQSASKKVKMSDDTHTDVVTKLSKEPALLIKKLSPNAKAPTRGSAHAAGYDMYASEACTVPKGGKFLVETGLSMAVPDGCYGRIAPRSGLAAKNFIDTGAGVIDSDYRGPVKILLFNHSDVDFEVQEGDRVAQLILERIYTPEVEVVEDLEESVRGSGGFGSSGR